MADDQSGPWNPVAMIEELERMPERRLYYRIRSIDTTQYTFEANYQGLRLYIERLTTDPAMQEYFYVKNHDRLYVVMLEIGRLLHNFVAAALSLVDNTRNLYKELNSDDVHDFEDYQLRVERDFASDPLVHFVKGLRQHCQHFRMPGVTITTTFPDGHPHRTVSLQQAEILQFSSWSSRAKAYIESQPDRMDLLEVATPYRDKVEAFNQWFGQRERQIYAAEIQKFRAKEAIFLTWRLENAIDTFQAGASPFDRKEDTLLSIFESEDFAELEKTPPNSQERANIVIERVKLHVPLVPEKLQEKITRFFSDAT